MSTGVSSTSWKSSDGVLDQFPVGLRVLVVDDDPICLRTLEKMLKNCLYEVTKCNRAEIALKFLRNNKNGFDIVISDVHMPDMDGFKLLEHVGLEMDLPVIMMSADDSKNVVMKCVTHGACDYLIKPGRMEELKNIWKHVVRKRKNDWKDNRDVDQRDNEFERSGSVEDRGEKKHKPLEDNAEGEENDDTSTLKKPHLVWSVELHQQFVAAVKQLGFDKAVPKKILELMNVPGLTRENVASHFQKYRFYLRRLSGVSSHHQNGLNGSFMGPPDANFASMASLHGFEFQGLATSQIPPQSLASLQAAALCRPPSKSPVTVVDKRNLFSFKSPKLLGGSITEQMNLFHGIPTNMETKQLASLNQSAQSMSVQVNQPISRLQILNEINLNPVSSVSSSSVGQPMLLNGIPNGGLPRGGSSGNGIYTSVSQASSMVDFSMNNGSQMLGNSYPNVRNLGSSSLITSKGMMQEDVNLGGVKKSRGFVPNHEYFSESQQYNRSAEWAFVPVARRNVEVLPSTYVQPGLSSAPKSWQDTAGEAMFSRGDGGQNGHLNFGLPLNPFVADNSSRVKVENLQDVVSCLNNLFSQPFGHDDIFNALLKQVCKFMELSFSPEYGPKLKKEEEEGIVLIPKIHKGRCCSSCQWFSCCRDKWQKVLALTETWFP